MITKEDFKEFVQSEFPSRKIGWGDGWFYVQAGNCLGEYLHYEYCKGQVHLHIEGSNWKPIRDFLRDKIADAELTNNHWGRAACQWTIARSIATPQELFDAFRDIKSKTEPLILEFEKGIENKSKTLEAAILLVSEVMNKKLKIPNYQRPYRWTETNVQQLLEDLLLSMDCGKERYRIGSVILHQKGDLFDIVDGQQRITTIALLLKVMGEESAVVSYKSLHYEHVDSHLHLRQNYLFIKKWFRENADDKRSAFTQYLLRQCEFVEIIVSDLSEAFQMFDSQNGRGKELEAYNLLKAFHIRAMELESSECRVNCDRRWENAISYSVNTLNSSSQSRNVIRQLFNEQLYRTRLWSRKEDAFPFSKKKIGEFKGITIDRDHPTVHPFQNLQLLQCLATKFYDHVLSGTMRIENRFEQAEPDNINPFMSINQPIVNGKVFFDYIETYVEIYKRLFIELDHFQLKEFKLFYRTYCLYPKSYRAGDTYLREVYKSLILILFDRFGEKGVIRHYKTLYALVYKLRLIKKQVRYHAVAKYPNDYFYIISRAQNNTDLQYLEHLLSQEKIEKIEYEGAEIITDYFRENNLIANKG